MQGQAAVQSIIFRFASNPAGNAYVSQSNQQLEDKKSHPTFFCLVQHAVRLGHMSQRGSKFPFHVNFKKKRYIWVPHTAMSHSGPSLKAQFIRIISVININEFNIAILVKI